VAGGARDGSTRDGRHDGDAHRRAGGPRRLRQQAPHRNQLHLDDHRALENGRLGSSGWHLGSDLADRIRRRADRISGRRRRAESFWARVLSANVSSRNSIAAGVCACCLGTKIWPRLAATRRISNAVSIAPCTRFSAFRPRASASYLRPLRGRKSCRQGLRINKFCETNPFIEDVSPRFISIIAGLACYFIFKPLGAESEASACRSTFYEVTGLGPLRARLQRSAGRDSRSSSGASTGCRGRIGLSSLQLSCAERA
jgi:hypothetical protein